MSPDKAGSPKKEAKKKDEKKKDDKPKPAVAKDTTPRLAIKVLTLDTMPVDGHWKHVFFTYDGSGKASGVKVYVNGVQAATRVVVDTLGKQSLRTQAPMQLGWRYPEATPAKETRYQDVRLYERALAPDEVKRLPYEDYVAEIVSKPESQWSEDQWHVVSQYYLHKSGQARTRHCGARWNNWMRSWTSFQRAGR